MTKRVVPAGGRSGCSCDACRQSIVVGPDGCTYYQCRCSGCSYDMCSNCASKQIAPAKPEPELKQTAPAPASKPAAPAPAPSEPAVKCPKGHIMTKRVVPAGGRSGCSCDACRQSIVVGPDGCTFYQCRCSGCSYDMCSNCASKQIAPAKPEPEPEPVAPKCPKGHIMTKRDVPAGGRSGCSCDVCRQSIVAGSDGCTFYQCRCSGCSYDMCFKCSQKK